MYMYAMEIYEAFPKGFMAGFNLLGGYIDWITSRYSSFYLQFWTHLKQSENMTSIGCLSPFKSHVEQFPQYLKSLNLNGTFILLI